MFHFSRRTLWIITYISIALIFVLHQAGDPGTDAELAREDGTVPESWSLDEIEFKQTNDIWSVDLAGANQVTITVAQPSIPSEPVSQALSRSMRTSRQGGQFLVTVSNPATPEAIVASIDFLVDWLPPGEPRQVIVSGPMTRSLLDQVERLQGALHGRGVPNQVVPLPALSRLTSPPMGSDRQLAFLLWIEVLQQRLDGYQPEVRWDHRQAVSEVLFNQTLSSEVFAPVTQRELEPVLNAYRSSASIRRRSSEQIHRYLVTSAVYRLPNDFLLNQPRRLADVTLADVDLQRARSLSEL